MLASPSLLHRYHIQFLLFIAFIFAGQRIIGLHIQDSTGYTFPVSLCIATFANRWPRSRVLNDRCQLPGADEMPPFSRVTSLAYYEGSSCNSSTALAHVCNPIVNVYFAFCNVCWKFVHALLGARLTKTI